MKLIPEWKHAWRFWSVRLNLIGSAVMLLELWNMMPSQVSDRVPPRLALTIALALFAAATVARLLKQKKVPDAKPAE